MSTTVTWLTAADVLHLNATLAPQYDDDTWTRVWTRPVECFGLTIRTGSTGWDDRPWHFDDQPVEVVPLSRVLTSTQSEGVRLDVLAHYLTEPDVLYDSDGWFGNEVPVLLLREDGTYTVRDGNHRTIAALLRGDSTIRCHVVPPPAR